jgi:beta-lactamase regulating signal transducer with metallopeptidase domain
MNLTDRLGWTLLHFLWQGGLIAVALAGARVLLRRNSANARYAAACAAMLLMVASAGATFISLAPVEARAARRVVVSQAPLLQFPAPSPAPAQPDRFRQYLPVLVYVWFAGVCALAIRSTGGWMIVRRFKRDATTPADLAWQERLATVARRLSVTRPVQLCQSALAEVPAVVGFLRPVVLVPASALTGLTPRQLEALLAHELAHVRRHDYVINLLQTAVETVLFYHPAVWWVGRQMRAERENCCDDLAVQVCGDVLTYARALSRMEELRGQMPALAMAADGGSLLERVRRLVGGTDRNTANAADWLTAAAVMLCATAVWAAPHLYVPAKAFGQASLAHPAAYRAEIRPAMVLTARHVKAAAVRMLPIAAQIAAAPQRAEASERASGEPDFMGSLSAAGYRDLSVDQLIALKQHGVTPEYIRDLKAAGYTPTVDQLIAFSIHDVEPETIRGMQALGYKLTADQVIAMQIHDVTPDYARKLKALGYGDPTFDQLIAMQIHEVTPEFAAGMKQLGIRGLGFDKLIAMRIHDADVASIREIQSLGFQNLSSDDVVRLGIFGVTPDYIRKARQHGFKDLNLDQIVKLKQFDILE